MIAALRNRIGRTPTWVTWSIIFSIAILIIIFNDAFGHSDGFVLFSLCYFLGLAILMIKWCVTQIKSIIALKRDKTQMEMLHLKSQVNPHFFFNTLNNLYGLVDKDPKEAQSQILKLSDLMRYSIYEGQNEWVSLEEEIAYIKNYIALHKNRYHKKVEVEFDIEIKAANYKIMPLLLILLVENAFKHGVEKLRHDAFVKLHLIAVDGKIKFEITNNFDQDEVKEQSSGIGMSNLKRRLAIGYKKDFDLTIHQQNEIFKAQLILNKV